MLISLCTHLADLPVLSLGCSLDGAAQANCGAQHAMAELTAFEPARLHHLDPEASNLLRRLRPGRAVRRATANAPWLPEVPAAPLVPRRRKILRVVGLLILGAPLACVAVLSLPLLLPLLLLRRHPEQDLHAQIHAARVRLIGLAMRKSPTAVTAAEIDRETAKIKMAEAVIDGKDDVPGLPLRRG